MSIKDRKNFYSPSLTKIDRDSIEHKVSAVLSAEELLSVPLRKDCLDHIKQHCGAPPEYFELLYQDLLENFAEFVQNLPTLKNHRLPRLDRQMSIASSLISLREPYLLVGQLFNRIDNTEKALWNYVVFSSALLSRLGEIITQYKVSTCDAKGAVINSWDPLSGSLLKSQAEFYRIREIIMKSPAINDSYNLLIATQIMPIEGLMWIASDPLAFEQWILGLNGDIDKENPHLLQAALEILALWLLQDTEYGYDFSDSLELENIDALIENWLDDPNAIQKMSTESAIDYSLKTAEQFLNWLRVGIAQKRFSVNAENALVFLTTENVLIIHPSLIEQYKIDNPQNKNTDILAALNKHPEIVRVTIKQHNTTHENMVKQFPALALPNIPSFLMKDPKLVFPQGLPPQIIYAVQTKMIQWAQNRLQTIEKQLAQTQLDQLHQKIEKKDVNLDAYLKEQKWPMIQRMQKVAQSAGRYLLSKNGRS